MKDFYGELVRVSAAVVEQIQDEMAHTEMIMIMLFVVILVSILLTFTVVIMILVSITLGRRLRQSAAVLKFKKSMARGSMGTGDFVFGYNMERETNGDYTEVPVHKLDESTTEGEDDEEEEVDVELWKKRGRGGSHWKKTKGRKK